MTTFNLPKRATENDKFWMAEVARAYADEYGYTFVKIARNNDGYYAELRADAETFYVLIVKVSGEYNISRFEVLADAEQLVRGVVVTQTMYDALFEGGAVVAA